MPSLLAVLLQQRLRLPLAALALTLVIYSLNKLRTPSQHPILSLLAEAKARHQQQTVDRSSTLEEATARYWRQHQREPPPGFGHWFETAQRVDACRVDGFEEMYESLKVWWGMEAGEIRDRMERMIGGRGLGRVKVRKGQVRRWDEVERERKGAGGEDSDARRAVQSMLEAVVGEFGAELPDGEPAVATSRGFNSIAEADPCATCSGHDHQRLRRAPRLITLRSSQGVGAAGRHRSRSAIAAEDCSSGPLLTFARSTVRTPVDEPFQLRSFGGEPSLADKVRQICLFTSTSCPTAFEQLRKTCPPSSLARKSPISPQSGSNPFISQDFTSAFVTPRGHFLASPELERSTWCDQPDLQDLHAAYIHPLSFTYTNQPFPVFSNSKIGGFNDILVPSWWYWFQVSQYQAAADAEWEQKSNKVRHSRA